MMEGSWNCARCGRALESPYERCGCLRAEGVGALTVPAAARLRRGDLIRVLGVNSWELIEGDRTDQVGFPTVQGKCPKCGGHSLFLGAGGYVTCSRLDCTDPSAPSEALGVEFPTATSPAVVPDDDAAGVTS